MGPGVGSFFFAVDDQHEVSLLPIITKTDQCGDGTSIKDAQEVSSESCKAGWIESQYSDLLCDRNGETSEMNLSASFVVLLALMWFAAEESSVIAVTVISNAKIYTVDPANPWAEALAIGDDGVLLAVGTEQEALKAAQQADSNYTVFDLQERLVLPGFHDVHLHAVEAGINGHICPLEADIRPTDLASRLESCKDQASFGGAGWIVGIGPE